MMGVHDVVPNFELDVYEFDSLEILFQVLFR